MLVLMWGLMIGGGLHSQSAPTITFRYDLSGALENEDITLEHYHFLEQRLKNSYPKKTIFSEQTPFSIVPNIMLLDAKTSGEMHMVKVVKVGVTLSVEDLDNHILFKQFETTLLATDNDLPKAISKAIKQFKSTDPKLKTFFQEAEKNVMDFYKNNCSKLIKSAQTKIDRKEFNKAYALLKYVPENTSCYNEASRLITQIYINSKDENCREMLNKARFEKAQRNYPEAIQYLSLIDPSANCYPEAIKLLGEIDDANVKTATEELKLKQLEFEKKTELEKLKILASKADFLQMNAEVNKK